MQYQRHALKRKEIKRENTIKIWVILKVLIYIQNIMQTIQYNQ